ncbi:hypothetical protein [Dehalobacterium formicoaceticum]|uniref:Uncharacterized protein n=1 Tax=Dehalobacterium formicoaceticum TaxID=51515 RepID=A0ABT1Y6I0_9FIRM|nr:hypothetical protein [Dehalobacterium formicoaceticum]MCR6546483.1 hypothetical protein [Dehalobacterium formicoaceticum]
MINNDLFHRFRSLSFLKDAIGLGWNDSDVAYFCTSVGTEVIGWLGVEGIHFCFIPSISSDMVFAVSPMPCGEHYIEPIARNFQEFLSLVLFCKGASPLEQICWIGERQFSELLKSEEENGWPAQDAALNTLCTEFGIEAHSNAYQYVKSLQADFDYSTIPYSKEYYDTLGIEK